MHNLAYQQLGLGSHQAQGHVDQDHILLESSRPLQQNVQGKLCFIATLQRVLDSTYGSCVAPEKSCRRIRRYLSLYGLRP